MTQKIAVFAGQGAQFTGMGKDLAEDVDIAAWFDRANAVLNFDLKQICFEGPDESLTRSNYCQPAIFVVSVACWNAFKKRYPACTFSAVAGLSLGEWTALHVAGVLDFETTVRVLEARGRFMQEACNDHPGGMVSVMGLTFDQVAAICEASGTTMANLNSESQIVLSGTKDAISAAEQAAIAAGGKAVVLKVAGAFHSPLMESARKRLGDMLQDIAFASPGMPVFSNVTGILHGNAGEIIKQTMLRQVTEPVRWLNCVRESKGETFIEFGPGKVLSSLIKRIDRQYTVANVQDVSSLDSVASVANA